MVDKQTAEEADRQNTKKHRTYSIETSGYLQTDTIQQTDRRPKGNIMTADRLGIQTSRELIDRQ